MKSVGERTPPGGVPKKSTRVREDREMPLHQAGLGGQKRNREFPTPKPLQRGKKRNGLLAQRKRNPALQTGKKGEGKKQSGLRNHPTTGHHVSDEVGGHKGSSGGRKKGGGSQCTPGLLKKFLDGKSRGSYQKNTKKKKKKDTLTLTGLYREKKVQDSTSGGKFPSP